MKISVRIALLIGIAVFGSYATARLLCPASALVFEVDRDGQLMGSMSIGASWNNSMNYDSTRPGYHYHFSLRVLSADGKHATFSYHFTSEAAQSVQGILTVGEKATQIPLQMDHHVSLLAYVKPNP
jgi:hypothetical protein